MAKSISDPLLELVSSNVIDIGRRLQPDNLSGIITEFD
jgi:hypothetical protein